MPVKRRTKLSLLAMLLVLVLTLVLSVAPAAAGDCCDCCCDCGACTGTPGYYKKAEHWPWGEEGVRIGGVWFTQDEAIDWLKSPVKGDKSITMFKALVAAKLNRLEGCCSWCIDDTIWEADVWLEAFPVGSGVPASSEAWQYSHGEALYWLLDAYNNGWLDCADARD